MRSFCGVGGGKGRWGKFGATGSGVESGREAQASVVLSEGLGGGPMKLRIGLIGGLRGEMGGRECQKRFSTKTSAIRQ